MTEKAFFFFIFTLLAILIQGMFAFFEMAAVSFHRVRLQYYVSQQKKRAKWLSYLLVKPSRLFGTTLIGVNTALQVGSECARQFYEKMGWDPDLSPITQFLLVVIFAELTPLFAARRHPEQAAITLVPLIYFLSRLLMPLIWAFDFLSQVVHRILGKSKEVPLFLSREEVKMAFEEQEEEKDDLASLSNQIFQLKSKEAQELMTPLTKIQAVSSTATIQEVRHLLGIQYVPFLPIYHRYLHNVVSIVYPRDLLRANDSRRVLDFGKSPWFISETTSVLDILDQFRNNNQTIALILNASGETVGVLSLEEIVSQLFGKPPKLVSSSSSSLSLHIERTLSGEMQVKDFNREFQGDLSYFPGETLSDLILRNFDHPPVKQETIRLGSYLFTVVEPSIRMIRTISVRTIPD